MFDSAQFRSLIIMPVLNKLQIYSNGLEELLMFTCATESDGGHYLAQVKGPALGVYQMEPNTYTDIWINFIRPRHNIATLMGIHFGCSKIPDTSRMVYDLEFATAMAALHYRRVPDKFPGLGDIDGLWDYYKAHYNTEKGSAKKETSVKKYQAFLKSGT